MTATILIVDDEPDIRELIGEIVADEDYRPVLARDAAEARKLQREWRPDLILLDVWMPDSDGVSLLREWRENDQLDCPVVMISGHGSVEAAVEATRYGACDFIEKPVSMARLLATIRKALTERRTFATNADQPKDATDPIGHSEAMEKLRANLKRTLATRQNILIAGEPGTGRAALGRWIHARGNGPEHELMQAVCGPECTVLTQVNERLESGEGPTGTLLLERVEILGDASQARLARLLTRLRNDAGSRLRVIATTLPALAASGRFDSALFHRLAELRIDIPPLRERREDIPDLVRHFSEQLPAREGLPYRAVPVAVQNRLRQHDWPGNARELQNIIRQLLLTGTEAQITVEEVEELLAQSEVRRDDMLTSLHSPLFELPLREAREAFERQYLIARLKRVDGSVGQLAEAVEMERTHLYRKLRQLDIDPKRVQENK